MAALFAAAGAVFAIAAAPVALADTCDPAVTVCEGGDALSGASDTSSPDYSPPVSDADGQYPTDGDFYFNQSDPLTEADVASPGYNAGGSSSGGGSHGGGGGGHR